MATGSEWPLNRRLLTSPGGPSQSSCKDTLGLQILLVEDHEDSLRVTSRLLQLKNYQVTTATTVRGALEAAKRQGFDIVISDVSLPDGNGHDLLRELRQAGPIKAIAVTGHASPADVQASLEAGFCSHLTKPLNFFQLEAAIHECTQNLRIDPHLLNAFSPELLPRRAI